MRGAVAAGAFRRTPVGPHRSLHQRIPHCLFVIIHVAEVFITGVLNEMRSMITGWFAVEPNWLPKDM